MIGETYRALFARSMFGSSRSVLAPSTLWLGWLSPAGVELGGTRTRVQNTDDVWSPTSTGVVNVSALDGGVAGEWTVASVGLWDAATGGSLVLTAALPSTLVTEDGQILTIPAGDLSIGVSA